MILNVRTHRRLSLAGVVALMALGAALLPLAPTLAAPDEPKPRTLTSASSNREVDANRLVDSMKSCQACHQTTEKPTKKTDDLHAEVVRLLDKVKTQKASVDFHTALLKKAQDDLSKALDQFEKAHGAKKPPLLPPAKKPEGQERLDDLEKKLNLLLREVEALRKEQKSPKKTESHLQRN